MIGRLYDVLANQVGRTRPSGVIASIIEVPRKNRIFSNFGFELAFDIFRDSSTA